MSIDLEIARAATLRPIADIAAEAGIPAAGLDHYGHHIAKLTRPYLDSLASRPAGRLILVTAINPTAAGEGKTTTTIGLGDALNRIGRRAVIALREPSLGPVFGRKGGATGGGHAQVVPMERINLHFTGDFHAITSAHNLLSAMIDNQLYWGGSALDPRKVTWRRVLDMNDRALRRVVLGLADGPARETGFDITVASEVMAVLCLAADPADLIARLSRIVVGRTADNAPVTAGDLHAAGAMAALLADAIQPNLVQTLGGSPALIHGGPFANIAHGCNSVIATRAALALGEFAVTEAGFGADLGAEKFLNIKCRSSGLAPSCAVVVATVRALKLQGGDALDPLAAGFANLARHVENLQRFGLPVVVAINAFTGDTADEHRSLIDACAAMGVEAHICTHWADGGAGAEGLARAVAAAADAHDAPLSLTYADDLPLADKIRAVARTIYRAADVAFSAGATRDLARFEAEGHGRLPVCMAKTPYSFTADEKLHGAPSGFVLPVDSVRLAAGAGFVVALCGSVNTMPGLPRVPAAARISLGADGRIEGLS
ncbi:formate--tetrahydrofolate ligase [Glacieibacterium frigidum]|uniref:Formate--tetrahydrofolate ligase n=1 Tax=Glacieibacterium frigidum TaxID=2593303 RepID=A0A552UEI8_9SPHN|nr:formate--tetrahydrofolate ligase [Glacieibacterium frigidum]TRW16647.1 formate--tetrahydrofolate ligase [Glacieibacterium frigidum]